MAVVRIKSGGWKNRDNGDSGELERPIPRLATEERRDNTRPPGDPGGQVDTSHIFLDSASEFVSCLRAGNDSLVSD